MVKLLISQEKMDSLTLKIVKNNLRELVSDLIFDKLEEGLSFSKIGILFNLNRSTIWRIYHGDYFPKSRKMRDKLLEKYLSLI